MHSRVPIRAPGEIRSCEECKVLEKVEIEEEVVEEKAIEEQIEEELPEEEIPKELDFFDRIINFFKNLFG